MLFTDHRIQLGYYFTFVLIHLVYIAVFIGLIVSVPEQIRILNFAIQMFVCLVLMYRFNPLVTRKALSSLDITFIFSRATIIFTNIVLVEISQIPTIKQWLSPVMAFIPHVTNNGAVAATTTAII